MIVVLHDNLSVFHIDATAEGREVIGLPCRYFWYVLVQIALKRRYSSRTFRYDYLVTTSPSSRDVPSTSSPLAGWTNGFGCLPLGWCDGRCVQGPGTYSPRHADARLLAIPPSWSRVSDSNPNYGRFSAICSTSRLRVTLSRPL